VSVTLSILQHTFETKVLQSQVPSSSSEQTTGKVTALLAATAPLWTPGWPQKPSSKSHTLSKAILCSQGWIPRSQMKNWRRATCSSQLKPYEVADIVSSFIININ